MQHLIKFPVLASSKHKTGVVKIKPKKVLNIAQSRQFQGLRVRPIPEDSGPGTDRWPFCVA